MSDDEARELLRRRGLEERTATRLAQLAGGHPLSLQLAAGALAERPGIAVEDAVLGPLVDELAGHYVAGLDATARRALDAASVVRRTTLSLLQATDPARHRAYRRAAWTRLRSEVRTAGREDLWRYTADMLYLVENPIVRNAFFPTDSDAYAIEPAQRADREAIIAMDLDPHVQAWWELVPEAFRVVRDATGTVRGFSTLCQTQDVSLALLRQDPLAQACLEHLRREPVPSGQRVLLNRHAYAAERGATATLWLDTKRAYLELRPHLRRLYVPAPDVTASLSALAPLGFTRLDVGPHVMLMNDFGPGSVDGWLGDVVGRELQAEESDVIDADGRRLVLDGRAVDLSRLELGVLRHLQLRDGAAVTREELLREVWGHKWTGGSNVVEVVISSLRRKLGDRAGALETVRGVGYRLGPLD